MKPGPTETELLQYLADLGWSDLYLPRDSGASSDAQVPGAVSSEKRAKDSGKGTATAGTVGLSRAAVGAAQSAARPGGGSPGPVASPGSGTPRESGPSASARRPAAAVVAELDALAAVVASCRECKLCTTRNLTVFASGDPQARLMLVGEGPGAEEDKQGLPFVGAAGELLNKILAAIGLARDEVYVANIVKCRPPGNRDPQDDEVAACAPFLDRQIALIRPQMIVALGKPAARRLTGSAAPIGALRGRWSSYLGVPVLPTFHPAYLLRTPLAKREVWQDLKVVRARLEALASATGA